MVPVPAGSHGKSLGYREEPMRKTPSMPFTRNVRPSWPALFAGLAAGALVVAASPLSPGVAYAAGPTQVQESTEVRGMVWRDADGAPIAFDEAALAEFLRGARVVETRKIGIGITGAHRLLLEQDGLRLRAAFRPVDETHTRVRLGDGSFYQRLRDYGGFEVLAYEVSRLLDMHNVPPTVMRRIGREEGSVQIWFEGAIMEQERVDKGLSSPDALGWRRQIQEMLIFDELIGNIDRNLGNMLIDPDWNICLIDHTRAFQQGSELRNAERIMWVRGAFWDRLRELDDDTLRRVAGSVLGGRELGALLRRRDLLIEHIQKLIEERGEGAVLY